MHAIIIHSLQLKLPRSDGHVKLPATVPDTITTWVGQGVALSKEEGIGFSNMVSLKVFKDFFVSLELPYSVNFGETVVIKPVIFNFLKKSVLVRIRTCICNI